MVNELLRFPLSTFQKCGLLLTDSSKPAAFLRFTALSLAISFLILSIVQLIFIKGDIYTFIDNLECIGGFIQIGGKMLVTMYYKNDIINLIELSKYFWNTNNCSKITEENINGLSKNVHNFQRFMLYSFSSVTFLMEFTVFMGKSLPIGTWQIGNQPELHLAVQILMMSYLPYLPAFLATFDNLYLGFCFEMVAQFKIFCHEVENLSVEGINNGDDLISFKKKLNSFIKRHKFLLRYLNGVRRIYSPALMIQYIGSLALMCTEMYLVSHTFDPAITIRCYVSIICQIVQMALYSISADFVSNEASRISFAIYNSNWHSNYFKTLQVPIQLLMQISQQDVEFNACGLIKINANTMVHVCRVAWSTNAILRNFKN